MTSVANRIEIDPGLGGRILDSLHAWCKGLGLSSAVLVWTTLTLSVGLEGLDWSWSVIAAKITRWLLVVGLSSAVLLVVVMQARMIYYSRLLGRYGMDGNLPHVVEYQAQPARIEHPFFAWQGAVGILIGLGTLMGIMGLTLFFGGDSGKSTLIALAAAVVGIGGGLLLHMAKKVVQKRFVDDTSHIKVGATARPPESAMQVPESLPWYTRNRVERILYGVASLPSVISVVAFTAWAGAHNQVLVIGGRVVIMPDGLRPDLTAAQLLMGQRIAIALAVAAAWILLMSVVIVGYGALQHVLANRELRRWAEQSPHPYTYPSSEISTFALTPNSLSRRIVFYCAGVGLLLISVALAAGSGSTWIWVACGVLVAVVPVVVDVWIEPVSRERRNRLLRAWPTVRTSAR